MTWLTILLLSVLPAEVQTWPAFLGAGAQQNRDATLPLKWSPKENVAWQAILPGHGQSSPVVWDNLVFVTSVEGNNKESYHTICIDLASGQELWRKTIGNSKPVANSYYVSRAAPTPVVDGKRVIALFESGDCVAFTMDGEELWRRNFGEEAGPFVAEFGLGASPCQSETHAFILLEHDGPSCLIAIDKLTGKTEWKADRSPRRSWSSPILANIQGTAQVVVSSAGSVDGYDPISGDRLWTFDDVGGNTGTSPIDFGNGRLLIGASAGRNGENAGSAVDSNCQLEITRAGDSWKASRTWVAQGAMPTWASPIVHQGFAYWINRAGVVFCFDEQTGEKVYAERIKQSSWATPVAVGDRLYFFGQNGLVTVLAAGRDFKILAENESWTEDSIPVEPRLPEETTEERRQASAMFSKPTLYGAAVANRTLLLRIGNCLIAVCEPPKEE